MGTRSLTHVHDDDGKPLLTFYKQFDGYPEGWGKELAEFLTGFHIVNGLSGDPGKIANGMGCLAAQIIAKFKDEPGQFYVYPTDSKDCGEDFVYRVKLGAATQIPGARWPREAHGLTLECLDVDGGGNVTATLFSDDPSKFAVFLSKKEKADA